MTSSVLDDTRRAPGGDVTDEPVFEARGIEYIPLAERRGGPIDLLWMWAGALFNVEYVVYGALIISFGLAFWQAALVIVIGNLSYLITGIGSLQGPRPGTSVFAISPRPVRAQRRPAGRRSSTGSPRSATRPWASRSSSSPAWRSPPRPGFTPRPA